MEEIQKFLTGFEKIIWHKVEIKDLSIFSLKYILLLLLIIFSFFLIVILLMTDFSKPFDFYFFIIFIIILTIGSIAMINMLFRADKKQMNSLNLTRSQLKKYEKIWILTNKRWIQKNNDINRELYPEDLPPNTLERKNDIIFANLDAVKAVMIGKTDPEDYRIWIYIDESFTEYTDPNLGVELESWEEYESFMYNFKKVVPLDEPEEENADYGVSFTYYLSQKFKKEFNDT